MLAAVLAVLVACALAPLCAEWVEISQNHYRRPARLPTNRHANTSLTPEWHHVTRPPVKLTEAPPNFDDAFEMDGYDAHRFKGLEVSAGKIERVPNIGSVKRVELSKSPVKSPSFKTDGKPTIADDARRPIDDQFEDEVNLKPVVFKDSFENIVSLPPMHDERVSHGYHTNSATTNNKFYDLKQTTPTNVYYKTTVTPKPEFVTIINRDRNTEYTNAEIIKNRTYNIDAHEITKQPIDLKVSVVNEVLNKSPPEFVTKNLNVNIPTVNVDINGRNKFSDDKKDGAIVFNKKPNANPNKDETNCKETTNFYCKSANDTIDKHNSKNEFKANTMENILKFMRVVTDTISKNTRTGVNGKVRYLNDLKETLLSNIQERIDATWPEDGARRHSRAAPRGHVEFPSSESALMTISFLTFAVFLIKLVLQVIQTYKNKAMIMAPVMVATAGRAFARKRSNN